VNNGISNIEAIMDPTSEPSSQFYPGGVDNPRYRFAFRAWMIFFLLLVCVGLLNYLVRVFR
jgi:hypothetical protein